MTDFDVVDALPSLSENDLREIKIRTAASKALVENGFDAIDANNRINVVVDGTHHSVGADELLILLATTLWRIAAQRHEVKALRLAADGTLPTTKEKP